MARGAHGAITAKSALTIVPGIASLLAAQFSTVTW